MNPLTIELAENHRHSLLAEAESRRRANLQRQHPRWVRRWRHRHPGTSAANR